MKTAFALRGFTLIEVILVVVLVSILSATVFVSLNSATGTYLDVGVQRVASDIRYAQSLAMNKKDWYGVRFRERSDWLSDSNYYYVYNGLGSGLFFDPLDDNPANLGTPYKIYVGDIYKNLAIADVQYKVWFFWVSTNYLLFNSKGIPCHFYGDTKEEETRVKVSYSPEGCGNSSPIYKYIYIYPNSGQIEVVNP
ncbi:MAG: prepilin-type N-terminal cleavage/methylation domain-containing protein [Candidatus Saganbacteria bacterium]|nr:prepilin-type N-terminal cleavage/methylation domain-containing protein [Candidatus Saganbacteria bacterium]